MYLSEIVTEAIKENPRLRAIPVPVIEEVLRLGLECISQNVGEGQDVELVDCDAWAACESCDELNLEPSMIQHGANGILVCHHCTERAREVD